MHVNKRELAEIFGVCLSTVYAWEKRGMPVAAKGVSIDGTSALVNQYDTEAVLAWRIRDMQSDPLTAEKTRLVTQQADKAEIEAEILRQGLVRVDEVREEWNRQLGEIRRVLETLPDLGAALVTQTDFQYQSIKAAMEQAVREVLTKASEVGHA